jgi:hypothetical protein
MAELQIGHSSRNLNVRHQNKKTVIPNAVRDLSAFCEGWVLGF